MNPNDFIKALIPAAKESMLRSRIPASFTVAQAALESAWGASKLAIQGFNLFGVKDAAHDTWEGPFLEFPTKEIIDGKEVIIGAKWRKYSGWDECIKDHEAFLTKNPRYASAFVRPCTGMAFAHFIAASGYATDPNYADKIINIIRGHNLSVLDEED